AVVLLTDVHEVGTGVVRRVRSRRQASASTTTAGVVGLGAFLVVLPFLLSSGQLPYAQRAMFFSAIFLSLVVLTGFSGQLNLGVAGFAGMGAFGAARLANDGHVPVALAIPLAA